MLPAAALLQVLPDAAMHRQPAQRLWPGAGCLGPLQHQLRQRQPHAQRDVRVTGGLCWSAHQLQRHARRCGSRLLAERQLCCLQQHVTRSAASRQHARWGGAIAVHHHVTCCCPELAALLWEPCAQPACARFFWAYADWVCNNTAGCGGGVATRAATCTEASLGLPVEASKCDAALLDNSTQLCAQSACTVFYWRTRQLSDCLPDDPAAPCGRVSARMAGSAVHTSACKCLGQAGSHVPVVCCVALPSHSMCNADGLTAST